MNIYAHLSSERLSTKLHDRHLSKHSSLTVILSLMSLIIKIAKEVQLGSQVVNESSNTCSARWYAARTGPEGLFPRSTGPCSGIFRVATAW